jgi:hypothetical protein
MGLARPSLRCGENARERAVHFHARARFNELGMMHSIGYAGTHSQGKLAGKVEQHPPEEAETKCAPAGKDTTVEPRHRRLRWISLSFEMRSEPADRHKARHAEKDSERKRIYEHTDEGRGEHHIWREPRYKKAGG